MKKVTIAATVLGILLLAGYSQRASITEALLKVALPNQLGANRVAALEDGLHVALCGAGGPFPAPRASGPCVAVVAGDQLFIVDTGTDGARNLGRMGYPASQVARCFSLISTQITLMAWENWPPRAGLPATTRCRCPCMAPRA